MEKVTDCESTDDSQQLISDFNMEELKEKWTREQLELSKRVSEVDECPDAVSSIGRFGGLDISFIEGDSVNACACYVVINRNLEVIYHESKMVKLTAPYIPSFLGFREADILSKMVSEQKMKDPSVTPGVLMVDGNGLLHPRCCGTACHVGVATGLPTLGVAKNLHLIEDLGLEGGKGDAARRLKESFRGVEAVGHQLPLVTRKGRILGSAVKSSQESKNPIFVSVGSGLSLMTAVSLVIAVSRHRVPEPIRQADLLSREYLRVHHPSSRCVGGLEKEAMNERGKDGNAHESISDKVDSVTAGDEIEKLAFRSEKKSDADEKQTAVQVVKKGERSKVTQSRKHSVQNSLHQPLHVVLDNEEKDIVKLLEDYILQIFPRKEKIKDIEARPTGLSKAESKERRRIARAKRESLKDFAPPKAIVVGFTRALKMIVKNTIKVVLVDPALPTHLLHTLQPLAHDRGVKILGILNLGSLVKKLLGFKGSVLGLTDLPNSCDLYRKLLSSVLNVNPKIIENNFNYRKTKLE